jgi:hypothetical protein
VIDHAANFWANPSRWPVDPEGHIFLTRAVAQIGPALHSEKWTGREPATERVDAPPVVFSRGDCLIGEFAHRLLVLNLPERFPRSAFTREDFYKGRATFTADEWSAARNIWQAQHDEAKEARERFAAVMTEIARQCAKGTLQSAVRPYLGGQITALDPNWWMTERLEPRFTFCQINPREPFGSGVAGNLYCWIFLTRKSLADYLARSIPVQHTVASETKCKAWLQQEMTRHEQRPKRRDEYRLEAQERFGVGPQAFRRAWSDAIVDTGRRQWSNPGRKKS